MTARMVSRSVPCSAKSSATAAVTGNVAANTAIGLTGSVVGPNKEFVADTFYMVTVDGYDSGSVFKPESGAGITVTHNFSTNPCAHTIPRHAPAERRTVEDYAHPKHANFRDA